MRIIFRCLRKKGAVKLQGPIHLIGRDMIEAFTLILLRQAFPIQLSGLEQSQSTHHIGPGECKRILDTSVYMALGRQMDDTIDLLIPHQLIERLKVANVHPHKLIVWFVLHIL